MDVAIEIGATGADIVIEGGDLRADSGLRTAVLVSLFSERRARPDQIDQGDDPRGWALEDADDPWGSWLWLLSRSKATSQTLELAREYSQTSLDWMRRDGIVQRVDVAAEYVASGVLCLTATLVRGSARRWPDLWTGELDRPAEVGGVLVRILIA